jgi:hypothetical protein
MAASSGSSAAPILLRALAAGVAREARRDWWLALLAEGEPLSAEFIRRGGNQEEAVNMDGNASYAREVERNVSQDNDFSLCG